MKLRSVYPVVLVPLLCVVLVATLLVARVPFPFTQAAPASGRVPLPSGISGFTKKSRMITSASADQPVELAVGLSLRNQAQLDTFLQQVSTPGSPLFHHYLNPQTFAALYGPSFSEEAAVSSFLRAQGFKITHTYANHLLIDAVGTVAQAEQTFQVQINNYQASNGRRFFANDADPSLPANVAPFVASVAGLDDVVQYGRAPITTGTAATTLGTNKAGIACPQPGAPTVPTSYTPQQIATAYNFNALYNAGDLGEGQTVGLLELDGFSPQDIAVYASCFGGKYTRIQTVPIDGFGGTPGPNAAEVELDMEMVLGLAPRLASLRVYEAANSLSAYNDAWARIVSDDVPVVSTSWVFCEEGPGMTSEVKQESVFFQAAAAQGETILAASGDLGATGCYDPRTKTNTFPAVDDPASQPYVTGVGGTTLRINADNTYQSEQVWNDRAIQNGASGGGLSQIWRMPPWQQGPGVANAYTTGYREVPDVSVNADPQTGYDVYCSVGNCAFNGGWMVMGGTSAAAPVWAVMVTLANEAAIKANSFVMGFLNPSLYEISHDASGTSYASAFHDVVPVAGGANSNDYVDSGNTYPDTSMYDLATGLGSFDAYNLAQNLITLGKSALIQTTPTSTTWYFAEGRVGADFDEYLTLENPNIQAAQVRVQYLFEGSSNGPAIMHTVPAQSRLTVSVNGDLRIPYYGKGQSLSMVVTSTNGVGIVAERPMYFSWHGINSGTDALGATQPGQDFYFADVESARNYTSYITILNPPGGQTANVTVTYYAAGKQVATTTLAVPAGQRGTTTPLALHLTVNCAVHVHSDQPVVVERPMYFSTARSNINGPVTGAATVLGAPAPNTDWLFAEGYTGTNFHEYLVLANFNTTPATATLKLEYSNGAVDTRMVPVLPLSQFIFDVNTASTLFGQGTPEVSAEVTANAPIVVQRQEYFRFNGTNVAGQATPIPGGTDVMGQPGPARTTYSFAEGYTTGSFNEFLTLQNPNTTSEQVAVTLYLANGITSQKLVTVGPQTRETVSINSLVTPIAQGSVTAGYAVSMSVQALTGTIVAERPMYFDYHNVSLGGTDVVGYTG
ncbi:MAG TPA: S53 family peptidase [Ktedonobacteraceae bacterium]|nr:S53 family peptidase [Ktedonobacteraceae bacterium]